MFIDSLISKKKKSTPPNPEKNPPNKTTTPSPQTNTHPKIPSELQVTLTKM